jgi:hypothetical protein
MDRPGACSSFDPAAETIDGISISQQANKVIYIRRGFFLFVILMFSSNIFMNHQWLKFEMVAAVPQGTAASVKWTTWDQLLDRLFDLE